MGTCFIPSTVVNFGNIGYDRSDVIPVLMDCTVNGKERVKDIPRFVVWMMGQETQKQH